MTQRQQNITNNGIALVTGVTRLKGIGKAICMELASKGVDIFFLYWRDYDRSMPWGVMDSEPDQIRSDIRKTGVRCEMMECDLSVSSVVEKVLETVELKLGKPSILVNNATYSTMTNLGNLTSEELTRHYHVNMNAVIMLTTRFANMFQGEHGRVINMTSGQSLSAMSNEIAYAVTKGAIETFTRTIQHELAERNITINAVNPGLTDSGWMDSEWMNEHQKGIFLKRFPKGRYGKPEDAARLVGFLASPEADWVTGQIIHSEGGFNREKYNC